PDGVVTVEIDPATGQLATAACPTTRPEVFISGTEPVEICRLHGGMGGTRVASWELPPPPPQPPAAPPRVEPPQRTTARAAAAQTPPAEQAKATPPEEPQKKKKGFFGRLLDVFK
ncbi:MAG TPA: penicillin-binding protein 1A, partial [Bryobacteraceae bacterium]|nr:penicillin-binding protein 1A [Bryobacteraceae bacterium]